MLVTTTGVFPYKKQSKRTLERRLLRRSDVGREVIIFRDMTDVSVAGLARKRKKNTQHFTPISQKRAAQFVKRKQVKSEDYDEKFLSPKKRSVSTAGRCNLTTFPRVRDVKRNENL